MIDRRPKQTYHPFVLVAFFLDILPAEVIAVIPRSTLYDWKHKQVNELVGYDWYCGQQHLFTTLQAVATSRQLLRINRALLRVIALQRFIKKYQQQLAAGLSGTVAVAVRGIQKMRIVLGDGIHPKSVRPLPYILLAPSAEDKVCSLCVKPMPAKASNPTAVQRSKGYSTIWNRWPISALATVVRLLPDD